MEDAKLLELIHSPATREKGYRLLMSKYQERLYWQIRKMVKTHEDTDDVLQNTFIKVFRNIEKFSGKSTLYTWLYRIATNESMNHLKKQQRQISMQNGAYDISDAHHLTAASMTDGDQIQQKLESAIQRLPEKQKMVFELRYYQEIPYAELSKMLDTSVGGLKALFHHAAKKVEKYVLEATV